MDLFEYQAKELFAKHGVPVTPGAVATSPDEVRAAAEAFGGTVVVKAQVKTGGRGKAGGVKLGTGPGRGARRTGEPSSAWTSRATPSTGCWSTPAADIAEEYYVSFLLDRANRTYLAMASVEGGMDIEEVAGPAGGPGQDPSRRPRRRRRGQGRRDRRRGRLPARRRRRCRRRPGPAVAGARGGGRHARRGQPAGEGGRRHGACPRRQGHPRRERRLPSSRARGARRSARQPTRSSCRPRRRTSTTSSSTDQVGSSATVPGWS